ncbi:hypothetical protein [Streptomyces kronopolitis]|uniref:hypothetical protein n=1 Tax=Streptomyces kronopolitis TaxID=1612435 RepID=UPI0034244B87
MDFTFVESKRDHGRDCFVYTGHGDLDLLSVGSLRGRVGQDRFGLPAVGPDRDTFTPHTTHMLVMVEGEVVASAELVAYSPLGLPLTEWPALQGVLRHSGRLVQCRRPVMHPEFAEARLPELPFGALGGLLKGCLQWAVLHDVSGAVVELGGGRTADRLIKLGFTSVEGSGPPEAPRTYRLHISQLVARSFQAANPFYHYLLKYDESVLVGEPSTAIA